jgi:hypothetical protein
MPKNYVKQQYLSGINLEDLANALTNPNERFEFPIKPWKAEIDLSQETKTLIYLVGGGIAIGLLVNAFVNYNRSQYGK